MRAAAWSVFVWLALEHAVPGQGLVTPGGCKFEFTVPDTDGMACHGGSRDSDVTNSLSRLQSQQETADMRFRGMTDTVMREVSSLHNKSRVAEGMITALVSQSVSLVTKVQLFEGVEREVKMLASQVLNISHNLAATLLAVSRASNSLQTEVSRQAETNLRVNRDIDEHRTSISHLTSQTQSLQTDVGSIRTKVESMDDVLKTAPPAPAAVLQLQGHVESLQGRISEMELTHRGQMSALNEDLEDIKRKMQQQRNYPFSD